MRHSIGIALALVLVALAAPSPSPGQERGPAGLPAPVVSEIVHGMPRGETQHVRVIVATLGPGQATPFHTHRFPVTAYVLEGTFTLEMEGRAPVVVRAGQAIVEPLHVRMTGYNRSASDAVRVVIFYVSDPEVPFLDVVGR